MNKLIALLLFTLFSPGLHSFKNHVSISVVCHQKKPPKFVVNSSKYSSIKIVEVRDEADSVIWLSLQPDVKRSRKNYLAVYFGKTKDNLDVFERPRDTLVVGKIYQVNVSVPGAGGHATFEMIENKGLSCRQLNN
jgi:hypothetical protein